MSKIKDAIKQLVGETEGSLANAQVKSVDWNKRECTVELSDGRTVEGVRLRAVADEIDKGVSLKPKVDSTVLVGLIDGFLCVLMFTEVDTVHVKSDNDVMVIDVRNGTVEFNGGNNKGLLILDNSVERWNKIESDVNTLKGILQTVLTTTVNEPGLSAPSAFQIAMQAAFASYYGQQLETTTANHVENTKVRH